MDIEKIIKSIEELNKNRKKRKFNQTIELIINLREFDLKKNSLNVFAILPHKIKDKKVAGFLEKKSEFVDTITLPEFDDFKDKKKLKIFVKKYDFFIANAKLMPKVAATFGRFLGQSGKMPSPQIGILIEENEESIKKLLEKIDLSVKIKAKEPSIKIAIGKEDMGSEDIAENVSTVYNEVVKALPRGVENISSVMIRLTMSKPIKIEI